LSSATTAETPLALGSASARRSYVREVILPRIDPRPYINGAFVDASTNRSLGTTDPFDEATLAELPDCGAADVERAVGAARAAFDDGRWSRLTGAERASYLRRLAELIEDRHDHLAFIESSDVGKPISGTTGWDISNAATMYRYYADLAEHWAENAEIPGAVRAYERREPVGVVAVLVAWNFPFPCISWKLGPALAMGCTVVLKPAERAPLSALALAQLVSEAGFPAGVVNVITGAGGTAGAALVSDPRIDAITFTGGSSTASELLRASASRLPRMALELGGKGATVVWADADFDSAVAGTATAMFDVAGQNCCAGSRAFVHERIADDFVAAVVELAERRILGDQLDQATEQGPQIDAAHVARIAAFVDEARAAGARVLTGGRTPDSLGGNFYAPTILEDVTDDMRVAREEVFGPVGCIYRVGDDLDAAITRVNDTPYGLSSSIYSNDDEILSHFVDRARVGVCWVNTFGLFDPEVPWGGTRLSGYGRELGHAALREFTTSKSVYWQRT
jgi:acyl-CoA reductase-like NAD-dependent aldehyde dehydrogenase